MLRSSSWDHRFNLCGFDQIWFRALSTTRQVLIIYVFLFQLFSHGVCLFVCEILY